MSTPDRGSRRSLKELATLANANANANAAPNSSRDASRDSLVPDSQRAEDSGLIDLKATLAGDPGPSSQNMLAQGHSPYPPAPHSFPAPVGTAPLAAPAIPVAPYSVSGPESMRSIALPSGIFPDAPPSAPSTIPESSRSARREGSAPAFAGATQTSTSQRKGPASIPSIAPLSLSIAESNGAASEPPPPSHSLGPSSVSAVHTSKLAGTHKGAVRALPLLLVAVSAVAASSWLYIRSQQTSATAANSVLSTSITSSASAVQEAEKMIELDSPDDRTKVAALHALNDDKPTIIVTPEVTIGAAIAPGVAPGVTETLAHNAPQAHKPTMAASPLAVVPAPSGLGHSAIAPSAGAAPKKVADIQGLGDSNGPAGTLGEEMKKAAGASDDRAQTTKLDSPQFAPGSVPQKPSQGALTSALSAVLGSARACTAGDDDVSRATVVFSSSGSVQSVSVSGFASGKPSAECIKMALLRAHVSPFAEASFTTAVTIRH